MPQVTRPSPLISKADASYVFYPETEYRCSDQCINVKSDTLCAILGALVQINAPAGSCDYYIHGGKTDWEMPVTGCITKESAGYAENPSKQGFGCKRCKYFDADGLDCYRGVDKDSPGPAPGIIHPNGCCNLNEPDAKRGKMTREQLVDLFDSAGLQEAARLSRSDMSLTKPFEVLALRLQEASGDMSHSDIRSRVGKAVQDAAGQGYSYVHDVFGDDESGDVVHSTNGKMLRSPYTISDGVASVGDGTPVIARTVYDEEPDEDDRMAAMAEAKIYSEGAIPLCERFVSKDERDAASSEDFAGKGKSFPILKPEDVSAAARSLGRAGSGNSSPSTIKARIIAIAKRKGWTKYLPKAWQDGGTQESARSAEVTEFVALRESSVAKDGTTLLKLMAPGWSANGNHYSEAVLKRDGPKVFRSGTKNYWNHQTAAEAAARPEGNLDDLAGALTEDAHWESKGPAGAGLYAKATVYEHYRRPVDSMAKHIGVSIRALGEKRVGTVDGKRGNIIEKLTHGQSADYVTEPSAGGEIVSLFEAARPHQQERGEIEMDQAQVTALVESAVKAQVAPLVTENAGLKQRLARFDAATVCDTVLKGIKLHEAAAARTKKRVVEGLIPLTEAGGLDEAKLKPLIESIAAEEQAYAAQFVPTGVRGMGAAVAPSADEQKVFEADQETAKSNIHALAGIPMKKEAA